jgi:hypothetical protein
MSKSNWTLVQTIQKRIRVTRVDSAKHHVDAVDLDGNIPICLDADVKVDLGKVKRAKIYQATVSVYETEFTAELEQQVLESALGDPQRYKALQAMKASGSKPTKYELIALRH